MTSSENAFPVFQIIAGISVDGRITDLDGHFEKYSSKEDQGFLKKKIAESDALIMGRKTFEKHVKTVKKPLVVFSRQIQGIQIDKKDGQIIHWFNDSVEELHNLCRVLKYKTVSILGGAEIYHWSMEQKLATDLHLTVEPVFFGKGKHLLEGVVLTERKNWKLQSSTSLNAKGTMLLHYRYPL